MVDHAKRDPVPDCRAILNFCVGGAVLVKYGSSYGSRWKATP